MLCTINDYRWSDGTPTDFIHWEIGEPNNEGGMELCVALEIHTGDTAKIFGSLTLSCFL